MPYLIVLALSVSFAGCDDRESVQQLAKLRQIAADMPLYPGFNQIRLSDNNKIGDAILTIYYRSPASYDAVKDFYSRELVSKGWSGPKAEEFGFRGHRELTFSRGEYHLSIESPGADESSSWNYAISYQWKTPQ